MDGKACSYCCLRDITIPFRVKIDYLEGTKPLAKASELVQDPELALTLSNTEYVFVVVIMIPLF